MKISVHHAVPRDTSFQFKEPVSLTIDEGEHIAFVGANGGGKSVLAHILTGGCPLREGGVEYDFSPVPVYTQLKHIAFRDSYGPADASYYLQQRWHSQDREDAPIVRDVLGEIPNDTRAQRLCTLFDIPEMMDKQMVLLSSG